jgi:eukaryotic-like serine/threonine-protein kinase
VVSLAHGVEEESTHADGSPLLLIDDGPWVFAGRYEIQALLGVGGMGSVYKALDRELDDVIALKVVRSELIRVKGVVGRFRREVKLSRKVTHRNVARVYDLGEADGERYFTMEYVDGPSLGTKLADEPLPLSIALRVGRNLCDGLAAAHAAGVIHRDLKPDNVVLGSGDRAVITDFGIARSLGAPSGTITLDGTWIGTPVYMAPELIAGQAVADEACDVFALGAVLFEAITRELPWRGDSSIAIALARLQSEPLDPRVLRPGLPDALAEVILRCLARDRAQRFPTAQAVGRALEAIVLPATSSYPGGMPARAIFDTLPAWSVDRVPLALAPATSGAIKTVAVLPFREVGVVDRYVSDGLTESLIDALSATRLLRVRPRGMIAGYRDSPLPPIEIGRRLEAQVVVEGTIERRENMLSIVVRVTTVSTRFRVWAGHLERQATDVIAVGEEIARLVADSLSADREGLRVLSRPTDPRALDIYLRARHAYQGFWRKGADRAVALFERAVELAPNDAAVLAGYALACIRESSFVGAGLTRALNAVDRARALDPEQPDVRLAVATVKLQEGDPVSAVRQLKAALAVAPSLGEAHGLLGRILLEADVMETAKKRLEWALAIEPDLAIVRHDLARANALLGRWDEIEKLARTAPEGHEGGAWIDRARFAVWERNPENAAIALDMFTQQSENGALAGHVPTGLVRAFLKLAAQGTSPYGDDAFEEFLAKGKGSPRRNAFVAQIEAEALAFLDRRPLALAAILRATDAGLIDLAWLDRCPLFTELRGDAAFEQARSRVGAVASAVREAVFDE